VARLAGAPWDLGARGRVASLGIGAGSLAAVWLTATHSPKYFLKNLDAFLKTF